MIFKGPILGCPQKEVACYQKTHLNSSQSHRKPIEYNQIPPNSIQTHRTPQNISRTQSNTTKNESNTIDDVFNAFLHGLCMIFPGFFHETHVVKSSLKTMQIKHAYMKLSTSATQRLPRVLIFYGLTLRDTTLRGNVLLV